MVVLLSQAVLPSVRYNVTRAVMGLGAIPDVVAMLREPEDGGDGFEARDISTADVAVSAGVTRRATLGFRDFFAAGADAASVSIGDGSSIGSSEWGDDDSTAGSVSVLSILCIDDDAAGAIESAAVLLGAIMAAGDTEGAEDDPAPFALSDDENAQMLVCGVRCDMLVLLNACARVRSKCRGNLCVRRRRRCLTSSYARTWTPCAPLVSSRSRGSALMMRLQGGPARTRARSPRG